MAHTLFHDVGVETLYTGYSIGYTYSNPMHILFRPCGGLGLGFGVRVLVVVRV